MAFALPRKTQLTLEQTLAQWPHWHCTPALSKPPRVVTLLTSGISNFSVLVESGQQFVVRIDRLSPASNGLSRQTEWRTLEHAHKAGLAPQPRYFNPDLGSLVCDYLEPDTTKQSDIADTGQLLRAIHQLPARHHRLHLTERILRYEKQLEHRQRPLSGELLTYRDPVMALLQKTGQQPGETVLCHNDLLRANRIYHRGKLWALDWEYCAMGNPWYDIAVVVNGDSLTAGATATLLNTYLGRKPRDEEIFKLHQYSVIYRYLELLWYLALDEQALTATAIEEKTATLGVLLLQHPD